MRILVIIPCFDRLDDYFLRSFRARRDVVVTVTAAAAATGRGSVATRIESVSEEQAMSHVLGNRSWRMQSTVAIEDWTRSKFSDIVIYCSHL